MSKYKTLRFEVEITTDHELTVITSNQLANAIKENLEEYVSIHNATGAPHIDGPSLKITSLEMLVTQG